jgi:hypothetical protein
VAQSGQACRLIAQRLVDAKAAGLASRIESLPAHLFTLPEQVRPAAAVQELGQMHLLAAAYRRQDALPPALKADVRQAVGWTVTREALLADANALRVAATWRVVAVESEVQPDRLRRVETWLWREGSGDAEPRCAVLIDFVPVATGAASGGYLAGDRIVAELAFYPSAAPLRAQLAEVSSGAQRCEDDLDLGGGSFGNAFEQFESSLGKLPWLGRWPLGFAGARVRRAHDSLYLCDTETAFAVPLHPAQASLALPLAGLDSIDGIGLWNGYYLTMCWAQTELGRWVNA